MNWFAHGPVAHALVRAVSRLVSTPARVNRTLRRDESRRGTQECVRYLAIALAFSAFLAAADAPHLYFSKSFPGSAPAFVAINLDKTGAGDYKEAADDDNPVRFQLSEPEVTEIFSLAEKLGYFDHPLESPLKVAFMGTKIFRFEDGAKKHEVKFNFSEDPNAQTLLDWFERISESEQLLTGLEISAKYDRLGVEKALLLLGAASDRKRLVDVQQYLPMLDRIAKNESYIHQARLRAAAMAEAIRAPK